MNKQTVDDPARAEKIHQNTSRFMLEAMKSTAKKTRRTWPWRAEREASASGVLSWHVKCYDMTSNPANSPQPPQARETADNSQYPGNSDALVLPLLIAEQLIADGPSTGGFMTASPLWSRKRRDPLLGAAGAPRGTDVFTAFPIPAESQSVSKSCQREAVMHGAEAGKGVLLPPSVLFSATPGPRQAAIPTSSADSRARSS